MVFVTACSQKIDGTSLEAFQASFKKMSAKMVPEKAREFDKDLTTIMSLKGLTLGELRGYVNGMTVDDVHKDAETMNAAAKSERATQVKAKIEKLEQEEVKANAQKAEVAKFGVTVNDIKGQWKYDPEGYDRPENRAVSLSLTLQNKTPYTITEFSYELSPTINGREHSRDPWSYMLEQPLVPGKTVTILITDKGRGADNMNSSISSRITDSIIEAIKANSNSSLSATIKLSTITLADGTRLDAEPYRQDTLLNELRTELAGLTPPPPVR